MGINAENGHSDHILLHSLQRMVKVWTMTVIKIQKTWSSNVTKHPPCPGRASEVKLGLEILNKYLIEKHTELIPGVQV